MSRSNLILEFDIGHYGDATWIWTGKDVEKKTGSWTTKDNSITISIKGNSGTINETFNLVNGVFVEYGSSKRYLRKIK